jgi:hypothetical protein
MRIVGAISKNDIFKDQALKYDDLVTNKDWNTAFSIRHWTKSEVD